MKLKSQVKQKCLKSVKEPVMFPPSVLKGQNRFFLLSLPAGNHVVVNCN